MTEEIFPLVNNSGDIIGKATRSECHNDKTKIHPVVHCIITNTDGQWLLQKRATTKDIQPGKWDTSVGGHIQYDEEIPTALMREVEEEVGLCLAGSCFKFLYSYIMYSEVETEYVHTFIAKSDGPFIKQDSEIDELRFWSEEEIKKNIGTGIFTPNFEDEFIRYQRSL